MVYYTEYIKTSKYNNTKVCTYDNGNPCGDYYRNEDTYVSV
jgi:hypothetical protein